MGDYTSRSKEYAAQEKADKKRQAADVKAGEAAIKSQSKEYAAQEKADKKRQAAELKANKKRQAADVKAGEAAIKKRNKEDAKRLKDVRSGTLNTYTEAKSYGGGRYRQPRRALGILSDAKRLLRI